MISKLSTIFTFFIFSIVFISSPILLAQDNDFEDYAFDDYKKIKPPYFALSFGGHGTFLFLNYDDINNKPLRSSHT